MSETQEKEFAAFGFVSKQLRSGFLMAIMGILLLAVGWLGNALLKSEKEKADIQEKLYEKMLNRVDQKLEQPIQAINASVEKVNSSADRVDSVANSAGELTRSIKQNLKK